ncbi:hypothetical protein MJO29_012634 [Puccinia striiformis f. sp. tritici]|nr:hypothetical protein MJO29_012633 [Puccinia striiformis f. sp. tritici]KAI7942790.1 hypothetical protein MJO29_012634 [Puccinia striiformis f. sp. tritici]
MTKSTRSSRPELRGLLAAPTRPRGGKAAQGSSRELLYVDSPREVPGDSDQRRTPSDSGQFIVPSEIASVETGGGLGNGSRQSNPRILGSYPDTPYDHSQATRKDAEGRSDSDSGQRTRGSFEGMPKGSPLRRYGTLKKPVERGSSESEGSTETYHQRRNREVRQRLEPVGRKEDLLPFDGSKERALQAQIQEKRQNKKLSVPQLDGQSILVPRQVEKDHSAPSSSRGSLRQSSIDAKLAHTLLDSLDAVNLNLSTLDLNSETNLKTLVNSISSNSFEIKKNLDENVNKILNKLQQSPLPLAYAMTNKHSEIIASVSQDMKTLKETEKESKTISQEIVREIKELKLSLINNSDNIISSLREDAIIEKQQQNSFLEEFKKIMINQNKNMSNNFNAQISALNNEVTALNNKIEQISNFSPPKEDPLPNPWSQRVEQSPQITAHNSQLLLNLQ